MISILVRDFRGAERVDIECGPVAILAGKNGAGKTSTIQAVAAALTGKTLPIGGMTKGNAGALVRVGTGAGKVEVFGDDGGLARVLWPDCTCETEGAAPRASASAAGLESLVDMTTDARAQFLAGLLRSDPTREDFAAAMTDKELGDNQIVAPMWKLVCDKGWDGAHGLRKERGAELKGQWRQITGQNYGSAKAASYQPPNWSDDLASQTDRELEAAVADARAAHHCAIAAQAASGARRELLEADAGTLAENSQAVETHTREMTEAHATADRLRKERSELPPAQGVTGMPCPHCGGLVIEVQKDLAHKELQKAPEPLPEKELKELRLKRAALDGELSNVEVRANLAKAKLTAAQTALEASRRAQAELVKLPAETEGADVAAAEAAVLRAEQRLAAFMAKAGADDIHDRIASNEMVLEILAADGLRARKLAKVLDLFNGHQLAPLCEQAGWKPVAVTPAPAMAITYGGRDVRLCSASEQYRVRAVLQVAIAKLDGSGMLVLDAADILDAATRSALFAMLFGTELPALVAMTLSKPEQVPTGAREFAYWIEDGVAAPMMLERAEAA
jgi:hypothetical protein